MALAPCSLALSLERQRRPIAACLPSGAACCAQEELGREAGRLQAAEQELLELKSRDTAVALAAAAAERQAAERTRVELADLKAEYARVGHTRVE